MLHRVLRPRRTWSLVAPLGCLLLTASWSPHRARGAPCDELNAPVDRFAYLRQLTLDLLGRIPSEHEYEALVDEPDVPPDRIEAMLNSDEFYAFVRRFHLDLLWPAIDPGALVEPALALLLPAAFDVDDQGDPQRLFTLYIGLVRRGDLVPCADEPATFDENGQVVLHPWPDGTMRDGYVLVEPYWAPGTQVKVCALEAQAASASASGLACDTPDGLASGYCGCGPHLEHCLSLESAQAIASALREQVARMVWEPVSKGGDYFDFLVADHEPINGPLAHYYRHVIQFGIDPLIARAPVDVTAIPDDLTYDREDTWVNVPRLEAHMGVLAGLPYLLRFQTGRARANRFYTAFLCSPFQAPPGFELPSPADPCTQEPNLRKRCGCNACHAALEPAAAWWGGFVEAGALHLDADTFPPYDAACASCATSPFIPCSDFCRRFYFTDPGHPDEVPFAGWLKAWVWRVDPDNPGASTTELEHLEAGPQGLVAEALADGRLARCTVRKVWERLVGPLPDERREDVLAPLVAQFETTGHDFRALVRAVVTSDAYRTMERP